MKTPTALNLAVLPDVLRYNWHIYCVLRSDAQVAHAKQQAGQASLIGEAEWVRRFDEAAADWLDVNPIDPIWAGTWPRGAGNYLGQAALERARALAFAY